MNNKRKCYIHKDKYYLMLKYNPNTTLRDVPRATIMEKTKLAISIIILINISFILYIAFIHREYLITMAAILILILSFLKIIIIVWTIRARNNQRETAPKTSE
jgi:hypothetical protein